MGKIFQDTISNFHNLHPKPLDEIGSNPMHRQALATMVTKRLNQPQNQSIMKEIAIYLALSSEEQGGSFLYHFASCVIDAFFYNDLFNSVKIFMNSEKGSFGLVVTSSLNSHRQVCFAARGQTLSIAFYPKKRIIQLLSLLHSDLFPS